MPHDEFTKNIFSANAIRTKEIIGVDVGFHSISGKDVISESGHFNELYVGGVRHFPKVNFLYAFRFGGELTKVPSKLPKIDGTNLYTGLIASDNKVFIDNSGIFNVGDHILINPYGISGSTANYQEEAKISSIYNFLPVGCCNTKTLNYSPAGTYYIAFDYSRLDLDVGDRINIFGQPEILTVTAVHKEPFPSINGLATLNSPLSANVDINVCVCLVKSVLQIDRGLYHDYPTGTIIANKFGDISETGPETCRSSCYDANHLYLEIGSGLQYYNEEGMTWHASGYRENFVGYSGIEVNITGMEQYGLLTLIYPKE